MSDFSQDASAKARQTMDLLWSRVRQRGDLPGFSSVVNAIVGAMRGDDEREFNMTRTVLQDPALTQKVLRLANSAMYSVFGQDINTVSKAVIVLGTEAIGHLALGLKLIDGLSAVSAESAQTRDEMEKAVLAGHIARQVVSWAGMRDAEEAVVCSILHSLGRMMAVFYLSDRWPQMQVRSAELGDENEAAREIFGLSLDDIGRQVAQQWSLPSGVVNTLRKVPPRPVSEPLDHGDWLAVVSTLSSRCADALSSTDDAASMKVSALAAGYADMLGLPMSELVAAIDAGHRAAAEEELGGVRGAKSGASARRAPAPVTGKPADAATILRRGVADMRGGLRSASTGQLMSMALETVYQGLGFRRTVAFVRDRERGQYVAHLGLGDGVHDLLPRLAFSDAYQPDVFHAAMVNDKMVFVENALNPAFANKVPRWWKETFPSVRSFMVLPLTVNRQALGFLYGDWDVSQPGATIEQTEIAPLDALRTLLTRTIAERRQVEPSWVRKIF
ncbi:MAG TPA: HDOD domain-containing protein [Noviherbaspirillum sp.]|nr:HDOD domain-containing protein [Noviherbaspirillum sp.]